VGDDATAADFFDKKAATWDDDPAKVDRATDVATRIARALPLDSTTRVLEYGAGTGLVSQALRPKVGPVTLAEPSAGMREVIETKIATGALTDARAWALDLATDAPPDEQFDLVVTVMVLHHIADLGPVLDGLHALLFEGGHLCVVDLVHEDGSFHGEGFDGHHGFRRPELASQLDDHGFDEVTFVDCNPMVRHGRSYPVFLATGTRHRADNPRD
jgi:predicted TPR repeat methyltransferase